MGSATDGFGSDAFTQATGSTNACFVLATFAYGALTRTFSLSRLGRNARLAIGSISGASTQSTSSTFTS